MASSLRLSKATSGIKGFNEITAGGLPTGRSTPVYSRAGREKTLFAVSFLSNGAIHLNEPGGFLSFEERGENFAVNVASYEYDVPTLSDAGRLIVDHVQVDPNWTEENGQNDLESLFLGIGSAVSLITAKRIILDTIEALIGKASNSAGFEECFNEYCRNALSVGSDLNKWIEADLLRLNVVCPNLFGLEMHLAWIHHKLETFNPSLPMIDPISGFFSNTEVHGARLHILNLLKTGRIAAVLPWLPDIGASTDDTLPSLLDTWIKLLGIDTDDERNCDLHEANAHGLRHSNQVREYRMTGVGLELITAYFGQDGVQTGFARLIQKAREQAANAVRKNRIERRQCKVFRQEEILVSQERIVRVALEEKEDEAARLLEQNNTRTEGFTNSNRVLSAYQATVQ